MNEDVIADLKQFIAATISQQLASQTAEIKIDISEIKTDLKRLEKKVDRLEERAEETDIKLNTIANTIGAKMAKDQAKTNTRLNDHEIRITKLEPQAA